MAPALSSTGRRWNKFSTGRANGRPFSMVRMSCWECLCEISMGNFYGDSMVFVWGLMLEFTCLNMGFEFLCEVFWCFCMVFNMGFWLYRMNIFCGISAGNFCWEFLWRFYGFLEVWCWNSQVWTQEFNVFVVFVWCVLMFAMVFNMGFDCRISIFYGFIDVYWCWIGFYMR